MWEKLKKYLVIDRAERPFLALARDMLIVAVVALMLVDVGAVSLRGMFIIIGGFFCFGAMPALELEDQKLERDEAAADEEEDVDLVGGDDATIFPPPLYQRYDSDEEETLRHYICDAFGGIERVFYDADRGAMRLDIAVSAPTEERNFYTLTTIGMGEHRMEVPGELAEKNRCFAELTMLLPPDWDLMRDTWPFRVLRETARRPFLHHGFLQPGNAYRGAMMEDSGFAGVMVTGAPVRDGRIWHLMLPNGKIVNFFLLLPILEDEWQYILLRRSSLRLWWRYEERVHSLVVDAQRDSCVDPERWFEEDILPFSWEEDPATGEWQVSLDAFSWQSDCFEEAGLDGSGFDWEQAARAFLKRYQSRNEGLIEFDSVEHMFLAASHDKEALRGFVLDFHDVCEDDKALRELLS